MSAGAAEVVGIDNQGESCLAWDAETGEPVSPVIVWQDERTADVTERLRAEGAEALTLERAGLPLDPYFSASKMGWIVAHVPEAAALARRGRLRLGTTDAWFRQRLTGRCETDPTTASRTSLMSLASCTWDAELCALFGVPVEALPAIAPTTGELGEIGRRRLTASVVDQQAALRGHGCAAPGEAKITFGTGAFVLAVAGEALPPAGAGPLPTVAWARAGERPTYALDGGVYAAGAAVNWARSLGLFREWAEIADFGEPAIARGLAFVPALAGLACPHWDRRARGAWMGMGLDTGPARSGAGGAGGRGVPHGGGGGGDGGGAAHRCAGVGRWGHDEEPVVLRVPRRCAWPRDRGVGGAGDDGARDRDAGGGGGGLADRAGADGGADRAAPAAARVARAVWRRRGRWCRPMARRVRRR